MKNKTQIIILLFILFFIFVFNFKANAAKQILSKIDIISAFKEYRDIDNLQISVPMVIEIPFNENILERFEFAVFDKTANSNFFEPYYFKKETLINKIPVFINANAFPGGAVNAKNITDNNAATYADFSLPENGIGRAQIIITTLAPITSSAFTILLDNYVALPNSIEIRAGIKNGDDIITLAKTKMEDETVHFPKTTANKWTINLSYSQPLRIAELRLTEDSPPKTNSNALRFLAQPGHNYKIYFNPDRQTNLFVGEAGNLADNKDVLKISETALFSKDNLDYKISDIDNDGVPDIKDNCVSTPNPDQKDLNNNRRGDACDDFDKDGILNIKDNCPDNPNYRQEDIDADKIGDACDKEESRITERYPWLPWIGIGFAALVLLILFTLTAKSISSDKK